MIGGALNSFNDANASHPHVEEAILALRLDLHAHGFEPIPVNGKAAAATGWTHGDMTADRVRREAQLYAKATNTGLRTGRLVGVDIDLEDPAEVEAAVAFVEDRLGETPFKRVGRDPRVLLAYTSATPIKKITVAAGDGAKVEILGRGQHFVAYGDHPDTGRPYRWIGGADPSDGLFDPPEVTPHVLRELAHELAGLIGRSHPGAKVTGEPFDKAAVAGPDAELDQPWNVERFRRFLTMYRSPAAGSVNDAGATKLAEAQDFGVSPATAWPLIAEWAGVEIDDRLQDAGTTRHRQNTGAQWALARPDAPEVVDLLKPASQLLALAVEIAEPAADVPIYSFADHMRREIAPVAELEPGWIEKGTAHQLTAPGGKHKSRLLLQTGIGLAGGKGMFGNRQHDPVPFVFYSYEDHPDEITRRVQAIGRRLGVDQADFRHVDLYGQSKPLLIVPEKGDITVTDYGREQLAYLRAIPGHKFVGLDGLYNGVRFEAKAKIAEDPVIAALGWLESICADADATLVLPSRPVRRWRPNPSLKPGNTLSAEGSLKNQGFSKDTLALASSGLDRSAEGDPLLLRRQVAAAPGENPGSGLERVERAAGADRADQAPHHRPRQRDVIRLVRAALRLRDVQHAALEIEVADLRLAQRRRPAPRFFFLARVLALLALDQDIAGSVARSRQVDLVSLADGADRHSDGVRLALDPGANYKAARPFAVTRRAMAGTTFSKISTWPVAGAASRLTPSVVSLLRIFLVSAVSWLGLQDTDASVMRRVDMLRPAEPKVKFPQQYQVFKLSPMGGVLSLAEV